MYKVIPGREDHEGYYQSQADTETIFLGALAERFSPERFESVEQQVAAVEHRHRQQIDYAKMEREDAQEPEKRIEAVLGHVAADLGDAQRTGDIPRAARARNH